ncbi:MAG: hypothetical protein KAS32_18305 [Candidatus Peribacteraceae bacterium]|nr:hypothetical protein [Candidatus Peribacteraceae bacterium]
MARPTKFKEEYKKQVRAMSELGLTDEQMSKVLGVSRATFSTWKEKDEEFLDTIKEGKKISDENVERSLFERATGYSHKDTHISNYMGGITKTDIIKHYAPDTTACIFWLCNRKKAEWKRSIENIHKNMDYDNVEFIIED